MPEKRVPLRKCVGCGEMIGKKEAVRIVRDKDGNISIDPTGKKSGRGAYICKDKSCLEQAQKGQKARTFVQVPNPRGNIRNHRKGADFR